MTELENLAIKVKKAGRSLALTDSEKRNDVLRKIGDALRANAEDIYRVNAIDVENAKNSGISKPMIDRLTISEKVIEAMAVSAYQVADLPDPLHRVLAEHIREDGLTIKKVSVSFGVIGIIFEARPNVTVDSALLCLKSGNGVILRGGKEAIESNKKLTEIIRKTLKDNGFDENCVGLITDTSRESAKELMHLKGYIDLLIPRGGKGLINSVVSESTVPVIQTGAGNCHIYVDKFADIEMAAKITKNAKMSRPSVCNAAESLLVHKDIADKALPVIAKALEGAELRGCKRSREILPNIKPATDEDYYTEYNDYIMSVLVVDSLDEAIEHINTHGTMHSECIVTSCDMRAGKFINEIDAAAVYHNASTRFTDGFEFGLGAEIGISTQKLHARGPMGLNELTTYKYTVEGSGQIR